MSIQNSVVAVYSTHAGHRHDDQERLLLSLPMALGPIAEHSNFSGKGVTMLNKADVAIEKGNPVAIFERELLSAACFKVQTFDLCTICGARFGIGFHGACNDNERATVGTDELPRRLAGILAKDHRQSRAHKSFIDLDF